MNYLEKATMPDLSYSVHQYTRFSSDPKMEHGAAVRWIGQYLAGTIDKGTYMIPDTTKSLEVYVYADFVGGWDPSDVEHIDTAKSRHGYSISYAGYPIC